MNEPVNRRNYNSSRRAEQSLATRRAILGAARRLFLDQGYAATTMPQIADAAGVAVDTIYASIGQKPLLLRQLIETAISGGDEAIPALDREYVQAIRRATDAAEKLRLYAHAIAAVLPRLAPLVRVVIEAGASQPEIANLWQEISERRWFNMRDLAGELIACGGLRQGVSPQEVADTLWLFNAPEFYLLVAKRGWTAEQFEDWLLRTWRTLLLA